MDLVEAKKKRDELDKFISEHTVQLYDTLELHNILYKVVKGCGYYLQNVYNYDNREIFDVLNIEDREGFVEDIVGYRVLGHFPEVDSLEDLQKVIDVLENYQIGYFDNVTTWNEAIKRMQSAGNWGGTFVDIDGRVYFDLGMSNNGSYIFLKPGQKLLNDG